MKKSDKIKKEKKIIISEEVDGIIAGAAVGMAFIIVAIFVTFNSDYLINETVTTVIRWICILLGIPIALACLLSKARHTNHPSERNIVIDSNRIATGSFFGILWLLFYLYLGFTVIRFLVILLLFVFAFLILQELFFLIYSFATKPKKNNENDIKKSGSVEKTSNIIALIVVILGLVLVIIQILQQIEVI